MTTTEAHDYLDQAHETEAELRGEYGMGAVSLGLDAAEWAPAYDGYRCSEDPVYAEALRVATAAAPVVVAVPVVHSDDLPF